MWVNLEYFAAIAELGSFTKAARSLHVSQPSLSVAIAKLEEQLETRLFVRHHRGVTLTAAGAVLQRQARMAFTAINDARQEILSLERDPCGTFSLGCHESLGGYFLPGFMGNFLDRHKGIHLTLWNGNSREVQQAVVDRRLDLGLVVNPESHPDCVIRPMFEDRVELVVSEALRRRSGLTPLQLLERYPLLTVPELRQVQYLTSALARDRIAFGRALPCSSMELVKSLVLDGVGVGILPMRVASHGVAQGRLSALSPALPAFDDAISLVYLGDAHRTEAFKLLIAALVGRGKRMGALPARGPRRRAKKSAKG